MLLLHNQEVGFPPLGMAVVGTVSSNTISFGTSETFNAGGTDNISVTALGANYFVVAYQDDGASGLGYARVGSVFGSTISYDGLETNFYGKRPADEISVAALSSSVVVIAFNDIPFYGCAVVGHVSGSLLSFGSLYNFSSNTTSLCSVLALDATRFVVAYTDDTSSYSVAKQGTISGSSIVFGPAAPFANGSESLSTTKLSSSSFVVAYHDNSQPQVGSAIVGSVLGTGEAAEITFGPPNFFIMEHRRMFPQQCWMTLIWQLCMNMIVMGILKWEPYQVLQSPMDQNICIIQHQQIMLLLYHWMRVTLQ